MTEHRRQLPQRKQARQQPAAVEHTGRFRSAAWTAVVVLVVAFVALAVYITAQVWPYSDIVVEPYGPLEGVERTDDGLAVVRVGDDLSYKVSFCQFLDKTSSTRRWIDLLGSYTDVNGDPIIEASTDQVSSSVLIQDRLFFNNSMGCNEAVTDVQLPGDELRVSQVYRLRNVTSYDPNMLVTVTLENATEPFLLLEPGEPIPGGQ